MKDPAEAGSRLGAASDQSVIPRIRGMVVLAWGRLADRLTYGRIRQPSGHARLMALLGIPH
jgi:hypothetical protein